MYIHTQGGNWNGFVYYVVCTLHRVHVTKASSSFPCLYYSNNKNYLKELRKKA